jgi:hypothetical protein
MKLTETIALNAEAASRRRCRTLRRTLGVVVAIGVVAVFPMQAYMAIVFPLMNPPLLVESEWELGRHPVYGLLMGSLSAGALIIGVYLLLMSLAGRKSVVLYLRRFRLRGVAQAMSDAIESGVGRHYRILTLDDANFVALEVPPLERWISRYGSLVPILGALVVFFGVMWVFFGMFERYSFSLSGIGAIAALMWGGFLIFVVPFAGSTLEYWVLFLVPAFLIHRWRVKKRSRVEIAVAEDLSACLGYCQTLSGKIRAPAFMAPQATVVKVVDTLWQETVTGIAQTADAIIIDVSAPTVHVLWEIETAIRGFRSKIVYLGQRALMEQWMAGPTCGDDSEASARIRTLLEGATVLAYKPVSRASKRRFRKSLRNALDNLSISPPAHFDVPASWKGITTNRRTLLPPVWKAVLLYVGLSVVCLPLNFAIWGVVWNRILAASGAKT